VAAIRREPHGTAPYVPAPRTRSAGVGLVGAQVSSLPGTAMRNAWLIPAVLFVVLLVGLLVAGLLIVTPDGIDGFFDPIAVN
jgi:hypothetical protein